MLRTDNECGHRLNTVSRGVALKDQVLEVLRHRIPYILFGAVFLFIGLCTCGIAVMRRRSGAKFYFWLGIWSAIEGTEYLFGSLADLGFLPAGERPLPRRGVRHLARTVPAR